MNKGKIYFLLPAAAAAACILVLQMKPAGTGTMGTADIPEQETETVEKTGDAAGAEDLPSADTGTGNAGAETAGVSGEEAAVDGYYQESCTILAMYSAAESRSTQTEAEAEEELLERGFDQTGITFDYSINGEFSSGQETAGSDEKHPIYETYYITPSGELWTINLSNGFLTAYPVSYNAESTLGVATIVSETDIIMGYDSDANMFYETIPHESELIVKTVDRIDAETLDTLTVGVIARL